VWEKSKAAITDLVWPGRHVMILRCTEFGMLLEVGGSPVPLIDGSHTAGSGAGWFPELR
jgi:aspartate/glutamate racemase